MNRSPANAKQVGGLHYKTQVIQPWDFIHSNNIGFLAGNVVKYVARYKGKNGVQDLEKAKHYLEKLIEEENRELFAASQTPEPLTHEGPRDELTLMADRPEGQPEPLTHEGPRDDNSK